MSIRTKIKALLSKHPQIWGTYQYFKIQINRIKTLLFFVPDVLRTYRGMYWKPNGYSELQLTSELLFQFHKLEKGLVLPGPKRFFGEEPAKSVMKLLLIWDKHSLPKSSPIYLGALETLQAYKSRLVEHALDKENRVLLQLTSFLERNTLRSPSLITPQKLPSFSDSPQLPFNSFKELALVRRSVRSFEQRQVPVDNIRAATELAQLSPSACNRQPCKVYLVTDDAKKKVLLALQNGNRGFGHLIPTLAIIVADTAVFFDASERNEPYIDGGLFSMTFMYGLASQGIGTCSLNWCVAPENDRKLKQHLGIPSTEVVIMMMAIGYPESNALVPKSPRKIINDQLIEIN